MEKLDNQSIKSISTLNLTDNQQLYEDKWKLKLNLNFRGELIKLLDEYTRLLVNNNKILIDEKELIKKNKNNLIKLLTKSPLKLDEESNSYETSIYLDNNFKNEIINNLIKNENFIIYYKNKIDTNFKSKLIEENNCIITKLTNLPIIQYLNNDVNTIDDGSRLESKAEKLVIKLESELSNLKTETIKLKEEIGKIKNELDSKSIKLHYTKKNMKDFFCFSNQASSKEITHSNIKWYIGIYSKYNDDDKKKYLGFYLNVKNDIDDKNDVKWKCKTSNELILKNNLPDKQDIVKKLNYTFDSSTGYGFPKFIEEKELFNLDNGYIKDDTIKLEVNLKVDKIEKDI